VFSGKRNSRLGFIIADIAVAIIPRITERSQNGKKNK
jgi:hypothetical protein